MIQTINKNKYKITVDCGNQNGHRKRISRIYYGNKKEAKLYELELIKQVKQDNRIFIKDKELTFNDLINTYLNSYCESKLKDNTLYGYKSLIKTIKKELGDVLVKDLTVYTLQTFYNNLKNKYKYSGNTILHYYVLIGSILNKTKNINKLPYNFNNDIDKPKISKKESKFYDYDDISQLMKVLDTYSIDIKTPIILCIDTGFRREELNGLKWSDMDFVNKTISVNRVRVAVGKNIVVDTPKTENSKRTIVISDFCIDLLEKLKIQQINQYKNLGRNFSENNYVFINDELEPIYPDTLSKRFKKIIEKHNLKKISFHELRHTSASLLIESNIDINSVSKRLGHGSVSTTLNIYSHVLDKSKVLMADRMNDILKNS